MKGFDLSGSSASSYERHSFNNLVQVFPCFILHHKLRHLDHGWLTLARYIQAPVTGRISDFIPLLPFSNGEQAVITHKCLLELAHNLRQPITLTKGHERLIGDMRLQIRKDGTVCSVLAKKHYHSRLGARSLQTGAETVKRIVLDAYLDDDEEVEEKGDLRDAIIDVDGGEIVGRILPLAKANGKA